MCVSKCGDDGCLFALRTWCKNDRTIRNVYQEAWTMRLVRATYWNAANVHDFFVGHATPHNHV